MPRRLTIAIPTYNRPEPLRQTLLALRPQAHEDVELVVLDNASNSPMETVVNEAMAGSPWPFRVIRNPANVGMCANILRCFEVANTEWLWILSDDDAVKPDAVATILQTLDRHPDLLFATYSLSVLPLDKEVIHESVDSFFLGLDSVPRIIFVSGTVYQRQQLIGHLPNAYNFADTGSPHTALLLLEGLAGGKRKLAYLPQEIVVWQPPRAEQKYSQFAVVGLHRLLTLAYGSVREHLAGLLVKDTPSPARLFVHLARDAANGRSRARLAAMLDEYFDIYAKMRGGIAGAFWRGPARLAAHLGLHFAGASKAIAEFTTRSLRGRPFSYDPNPVSLNSYLRLSEAAREKTTSH